MTRFGSTCSKELSITSICLHPVLLLTPERVMQQILAKHWGRLLPDRVATGMPLGRLQLEPQRQSKWQDLPLGMQVDLLTWPYQHPKSH